MKARMEQLINGRFEYEVPGLLLSQEKLTFSVTPEEKFKGELQFAAEDRRRDQRNGLLLSQETAP